MGWQDAPVVASSWQDAPVVEQGAGAGRGFINPIGKPPESPAVQPYTWGQMFSDVGRETAANALGLARGAVQGTVGSPGALEQLGTKYLIPNSLKTPGDKGTFFPTPEEVGQVIPKNPLSSPQSKGFEKLGEFVPLGPLGAKLAEGKGLADAAAKAPEIARAGVKMAFRPDAETMRLVRKAQEFGIPLRPDMLSNNRFIRTLGETVEHIPLAGGKLEQRTEAFNRSVIKLIGGDSKASKLTPDVFSQALDKSGREIGAIYAKTPVRADKIPLAEIGRDLAKETPANAKIIRAYLADITSKVKNGVLDGTTLRKLDTAIGRRARETSDGDLRARLSDIQDALREGLNSSLAKEADKAALQTARMRYARAIDLEPLVAKSPVGDISPAGLMQAATNSRASKSLMARGNAGDMGDLARVGQRFLKEPPSSGTAERGLSLGLGGALAGGASIDPAAAAGIWSLSNLYNRLGPYLIPNVPK